MQKILAFIIVCVGLVAVAPTAYAQAPDPPPHPPTAPTAPPGEDHEHAAKKHEPVTMAVGIDLDAIHKFEIGAGTFHVEFIVSVICDREPCDPDFSVANGKLLDKTQSIDDQGLHKKFKMKAEIDGYVDLAEYPLDKHLLVIDLEDKNNVGGNKFKVDQTHTKLGERLRLPGWDINPVPEEVVETLALEDNETMEFVRFGVEISRPRLPALIKSFVPAIFMLMAGMFGLFLRPKSIAQRFTTSVGGLVPLVLFHVSQVNSLPAVGYLTRMDKFMETCYFVFILIIAFNVAIFRSEEVKNEALSKKLYLISLGFVPGVTLVLWLIVFLKII